MERKNKKNIIFTVITYVIIFLFFSFALTGILFRASGKQLYFFGYRFDVVLTDSMSEKNPNYEKFLEGHNDQYQPFDVVVSKEVKTNDELEVYDIVLFNNELVGTDMHRIVGKEYNTYKSINISNSIFTSLNNYDGIKFAGITSCLTTNAIQIKELEVKSFSKEIYDEDHYYFNIMRSLFTPTREYVEVEGGYIYTYKVTRETDAPGELTMSLCPRFNFDEEILLSCKIIAKDSVIEANKETLIADGDNLNSVSDVTYKYEIRGDKANTSDGYYTTDKIYSKVLWGIPKIGYVIRYLSSIWGIILFIGLGGIIIAYDIVSSKMERKEKNATEPEEMPKEEDNK